MYKILLLSITIIGLTASCSPKKDDVVCQKEYTINIQMPISEQDIYNVGDTVWLSATAPTSINDQGGNSNIDVTGLDVRFIATLALFNSISDYEHGEDNFSYVTKAGEIAKATNKLTLKFIDQKLQIGMVCKEPGVYLFSHSFQDNGNNSIDDNCIDLITFALNTNTLIKEKYNDYYFNGVFNNEYPSDSPLEKTFAFTVE